jgi:hypothetical protein
MLTIATGRRMSVPVAVHAEAETEERRWRCSRKSAALLSE